MTKEQFKQVLTSTYGHRPFYFRTDSETKIILGKSSGALANDDCKGKGLKPFYIGKKAAYPTQDLIDLAVKRFKITNR
jgi:hypothetical protein